MGGGDFLESVDVEASLGGLDASSEGIQGVVLSHGDFGLGEDGAVVVDFVDQMDGDACCSNTGVQDGPVDIVAVHAPSAEFWEQGGVGVDDAAAKTSEGDWAEESHVSGQDYQVNGMLGQGVSDCGVEVLGFGVSE